MATRALHDSLRTEEAYVGWVRRFILFHGKRHPQEMGTAEINRFLTDLAVSGHVAASTQNQARSALLFLYQQVLGVELGILGNDIVLDKRPGSPSTPRPIRSVTRSRPISWRTVTTSGRSRSYSATVTSRRR